MPDFPQNFNDRYLYDGVDVVSPKDIKVEVLAPGKLQLFGDVELNGYDVLTELNLPYLNVKDYGAIGNGVANDTAAVHAAVNAANAIVAGATVFFPAGVYQTDALPPLTSYTVLRGEGRSSNIQHRGGAAPNAHLITNVLDARHIEISDLQFNGLRTGQTNPVDIIHFDNTGGTATNLARFRISNVLIENVKGSGIFLGYAIRSTQIDNVVCYFCDVHGMYLGGFADSQITNVEVGQSGGHGWNIDSCNAIELNNIRSWYSGRINTGTNGHGFLIKNGADIQVSNGFAQENSGNGWFVWGQSGPLKGIILTNCISNSDNAAASTWVGFSLNNVEQGHFRISVTKFAAGLGTPYNAIAVTGGTKNCFIDIAYHSVGSYALTGPDLGKNMLRTPRQATTVGYFASYTPLAYTDHTIFMSLAGPTTINNIGMSPLIPGWEITLVFTQDVTGGRVVTFGTAYKTSWVPVTTSGKINSITFVCDGTNWVQKSAEVGM